MSVQTLSTHRPAHRRDLALPALGLAAALAVWGAAIALTPAPAERSGIRSAFLGGPMTCETAEDALAAMDRSRNGISLTCQADSLSGMVPR